VEEQIGHSSTQITIDTYRHLVPGADIAWTDKLDAAARTPRVSATQTQPEESELGDESPQLLENIGGPARIRTLDQRIMSSPVMSEAEEDKSDTSAKQGKVRQKLQPGRNRDAWEESR
jgi:hypothetical protein